MKTLRFIFLIQLIALPINFATAAAAPDIAFTQSNTQKSLDNYKGKLIYLDFWASWCLPCRKSFPWMNDMEAKYTKQGFMVLAINLDKDKDLVAKFLKKYPANFTVAFDPKGSSAEKANVQVMPTSMLIDKKGNIILKHPGFRQKDTEPLEKLIQANL